MSRLLPLIDVAASVAAVGRQHAEATHKTAEDLDRYRVVIAATRPEVLVECGTESGGSARWFAERGLDVVTIDLGAIPSPHPRVTCVQGNAADPAIAARVTALVAGRRCMVSLDSDHSAAHVAAEIKLYAPLVTPGCYLVVEDGIVAYAAMGYTDGPLDAITALLEPDPSWQRDTAIERAHPVSMFPCGWWQRLP